MEDTKTIKTPIKGQEVVLKVAISMADERALKKPFLRSVRILLEKGKDLGIEPKFESANVDPAEAMIESENTLIKTIVVSVDGDKDNVLKKILKMDSRDGRFVIKEIKKITDALKQDFTKPEPKQKENTGSGN